MRRGSRRRGMTLLQVLMSFLICAFVSSIVFQQLVTLFSGTNTTLNLATSMASDRAALDAMVDHVRNAVSCTDTSKGGVSGSVLHSALATEFTYYTDATGTVRVRYYLSGGNLMRQDLTYTSSTTFTAVTTTVVKGVSSLTLSYFKAAYYNVAWTSTTSASAPTTAELPNVCGIKIDATVTLSKVSSRYVTTVRMRNAPKKVGLDGIS